MSQDSSWFQQTPKWVWWSLFPAFGGLAIAYAGKKTNTQAWMYLGLGVTVAAVVLSQSSLTVPIWLAQIGIAFYLKKPFLLKTYPKNLPLPEDTEAVRLIAASRSKIDINKCSKNDLVNGLGLPIVYANDIESLQNEGYIFTDAEELSEIIGIPETTVKRIAPLIVFSYDYKTEVDISWRRLNTRSAEELIIWGIKPTDAQKIVEERQRRGEYKSAIDVKRRTGLPLSSYRNLI